MAMQCGDSEGVEASRRNGLEFHFDGGTHALDLDANEAGFCRGLAAQAPKGCGHFHDEDIFDGVGGLPGIEVGVEEDLEIGGLFAWKDETLSVGTVGSGVSG